MKQNMGPRNSIWDYLPEKKKEESTQLIQAHLPRDLVRETKAYLRTNHMTWKELMIICLENFRDTVIRGK